MPEIDTPQGRAVVILLVALGFPQHRIASLFDENQGRISEIAGQRRDTK